MSDQPFDITFIGHLCRDEIFPFGGTPYVQVGSALLCGAMVAPRAGARTAVVTRMASRGRRLARPAARVGSGVYRDPLCRHRAGARGASERECR